MDVDKASPRCGDKVDLKPKGVAHPADDALAAQRLDCSLSEFSVPVSVISWWRFLPCALTVSGLSCCHAEIFFLFGLVGASPGAILPIPLNIERGAADEAGLDPLWRPDASNPCGFLHTVRAAEPFT